MREIAVGAAAAFGEVLGAEPVQSLWSGYGELVRVRLAGSVPSVVVKVVRPPARVGASHARKRRSYDVELAFYTRWAARSPARVPRLLAGNATADGWLLVLEDLLAAGFAPRRGALAACLGWLARFHAAFLGAEPTGLWEQGTYWHLATRREELAATPDPVVRARAPELDRQLRAARFRTLVHGDAKPANFLCTRDGEAAAAVDFQYVGGGIGVQDVAYLLAGDVAREEPWLDLYFAALRAALALAGFADGAALESEWRALYPVARADYERFLAGWMR